MFVVVLMLLLVCLSVQQPKEPDERIDSCTEVLDRGNSNCSAPIAGLRWYYDSELDDCFEYYYEGCDGGNNTFLDYRSCRRTCIPADRSKCGGNAKVTSTCERLNTTCPEGSECNVSPIGSGICCDNENEELWKEEKNPKCENGTLSKKIEWYGESIRFGRSCSHKFCPNGFTCVQGKRLAHCCSI